jgi:hypothetical protein
MVMYGYGNIISINEKQVKITADVIYSTSTSSTKEKEDFRLQLVIDGYALHASNVLKPSLITPYDGIRANDNVCWQPLHQNHLNPWMIVPEYFYLNDKL